MNGKLLLKRLEPLNLDEFERLLDTETPFLKELASLYTKKQQELEK